MAAMFPMPDVFSVFGMWFVNPTVHICICVGCVTDYLDARQELLISVECLGVCMQLAEPGIG